MSMIQNSFSSWSVEASAWVTLPFIFHVSIVTRLLQFWRLRWIFWRFWCQGRSIISGSQCSSRGNNDGQSTFIVQCTFTMHGLDLYCDLTASFNTSSRVWRSFSMAMTSKCRTFANSSSAPKAEDTMVSRGFIVNLVSFVSLVIMKRLRLICEQAPFSTVLPYSEPVFIAPLKRAHAYRSRIIQRKTKKQLRFLPHSRLLLFQRRPDFHTRTQLKMDKDIKKRINVGVWTGRREVGRHSWRSSEYEKPEGVPRILKAFFPVW